MKTPLQTKAQIDKLAKLPRPPVKVLANGDERAGQKLYWDDGPGAIQGFGVRVTSNGKQAYVVQARVAGKTRRVAIEWTTVMALAEARKEASALVHAMRHKQVDVNARRREEAAARVAAEAKAASDAWSLREVMVAYLSERTVNNRPLKPRTQSEIQRHIERNFGDWADQPVSGITPELVSERFATLRARAPGQGRQAMGVLRALLKWARRQKRGKGLAFNPVTEALAGELKPAEGRERMIPVAKVRAVWQMLQTRRAEDPDVGGALRTGLDLVAFGLLTGCRLGEAQNLSFDLINLDEGWWQITAEVAKDGKARTLPLCSAAVELLRAREDARPGHPFVFPSRNLRGREHFKDPRGALGHVSKVAGLHLSFHDLRRTWVGVADETGIPIDRIELLTSHKPRSVTGRHYRQKYDVRWLAADAETVGRWITQPPPASGKVINMRSKLRRA